MSRRGFLVTAALLAALYIAQGLYFARVLVPVSDGVQYLMIGAKAVRGEIGVFDDRLPGNRMPLPFYVLGLTQLRGPDVKAPRFLNVVFGLGTLVLTVLLARRLGGRVAGLIAGMFLATQGVVVAYYSYEGYPAFAALALTASVFGVFTAQTPRARLIGAVLAGLLFFVRSNLWPAAPFLLGYSLWRASRRAERLALVAVVVVPPLAYLASDPTHLKILAYVPLLKRLVAPMGYDATLVFGVQEALPFREQLWETARVVRRYEFWALATLVLIALLAWRRVHGQVSRWWGEDSRGGVLAAFFVYMLAAQFVMFSWNWGWVGLYFVSFAPLLPVLLGLGFAALLAAAPAGSRSRRALVVVLVCLVLPPLYFVRNPILPIGEVMAQDPFVATHRAAARLRTLVPADAKVVFYGRNTAYYLSGLPETYLAPLYNPDAFARLHEDPRVLHRFGFVDLKDMTEWFARDADVAVIDVPLFRIREKEESEQLMAEFLARNFDLAGTVNEPPFNEYAVYRRRPGAGASAAGAPGAEASPAPDTTGTRHRR